MVLGGCEISAPKPSSSSPSSSSSSPVAKKGFHPAIVGVQSGTNKGTGFIIGYDDKNNIVYILTQEHVVTGDPCPQVNFGMVSVKAYKKEAGGNYGDARTRQPTDKDAETTETKTVDNALALLFVQPNFEAELMKLQLRGDCGGIVRETVLTYNYKGEPATVDTSIQNGEICSFSGNSGITNGYSGAPLIKEDSSSVIGVISEFDPKVKAVSADTVLKFIKGIKESGIGESIMKLIENSDDKFKTRNHTLFQCQSKIASVPEPSSSTKPQQPATIVNKDENRPVYRVKIKSANDESVPTNLPVPAEPPKPPARVPPPRPVLHQPQGGKCECGTIHSKREMYIDLTEFENSCLTDGRCPALK